MTFQRENGSYFQCPRGGAFAYDRRVAPVNHVGLPLLFLERNESFARLLVRAVAEAHHSEAPLPMQHLPAAMLDRPDAAPVPVDAGCAGTAQAAALNVNLGGVGVTDTWKESFKVFEVEREADTK